MECKFVVGQKVVGRRDAPIADAATKALCRSKGIVRPKRGQVYTIREIVVIALNNEPTVALRFIECDNRHLHIRFCGGELAFNARLFQAIEPRQADISIFTAILTGHRIPEDA